MSCTPAASSVRTSTLVTIAKGRWRRCARRARSADSTWSRLPPTARTTLELNLGSAGRRGRRPRRGGVSSGASVHLAWRGGARGRARGRARLSDGQPPAVRASGAPGRGRLRGSRRDRERMVGRRDLGRHPAAVLQPRNSWSGAPRRIYGNLYGRTLDVVFLARLRGQTTFASGGTVRPDRPRRVENPAII